MSRIQQLFSGILLLLVCASQFQAYGDVRPPKVLILGDSLSAAYNMPESESWPSLFLTNIRSRYSKASVTNASISGETTYGAVQRLPELLARVKPTLLIIELGGNDGLRGLKFSQTTENFDRMIRMALEQDIEVLLVGIDLPPNLGPAYNLRFQQIFETIRERHSIHFLPRFLEGVAAAEEHLMQPDGIHPTAAAQPILAEKVLNAVLEILAQ